MLNISNTPKKKIPLPQKSVQLSFFKYLLLFVRLNIFKY